MSQEKNNESQPRPLAQAINHTFDVLAEFAGDINEARNNIVNNPDMDSAQKAKKLDSLLKFACGSMEHYATGLKKIIDKHF